MKYQVTVTMTSEMLCDLIITALETPAMNWLSRVRGTHPTWLPLPENKRRSIVYKTSEMYDQPDWHIVLQHDGPDTPEGTYAVISTLNAKAVNKALGLMRDGHFEVLTAILSGDYDAGDADTFMQLALLGSLVFG